MNILCQFRNVNYGQIFYGIDNLASETYDPRSLINTNTTDNTNVKSKIIALALECGIELNKNL